MELEQFLGILTPNPLDGDCAKLLEEGRATGQYSHLTKSDYGELLDAIAAEIQQSGEPFSAAHGRAISTTATGKALFKAMKDAPEAVSKLPAKDKFINEIQRRADELFPNLSTPEQRFARAIDTDPYRQPYDKVCKTLYEVSKSAPNAVPKEPEAPVDTMAEIAKATGTASVRMLQLADEHRKSFPLKSREQSYAAVYSSRENIGLKQQVASEEQRSRGASVSDID